MKTRNDQTRKNERRADAVERQKVWDKLTIDQKIKKVNDQLKVFGGNAKKGLAKLEFQKLRKVKEVKKDGHKKEKNVKKNEKRKTNA